MQQNEENEGKLTPLGEASILPEVDEAAVDEATVDKAAVDEAKGEEVPHENHSAVGGRLQAKDEEEEQRRGQDGSNRPSTTARRGQPTTKDTDLYPITRPGRRVGPA